MPDLIAESPHVSVAYLDAEFNFIRVNKTYAAADGCDPDFSPGRNHFDLYPNAENEAIFRHVVESGEPYFASAKPFEYAEHPDRGVSYWDWSLVPLLDTAGRPDYLVFTLVNVTARERSTAPLRLANQLHDIGYDSTDVAGFLGEIVYALREFVGCEAVGIRMLDENGSIPYQAYTGFSRQFYELEHALNIKTDRCMCINVIEGKTDTAMEFYTPGGSFLINATTRFLSGVSKEDKGETRNMCNAFGYETVALIPIRRNEEIIGLIHYADRRENMIAPEIMGDLERIGRQIGTVIRRIRAEQEVLRARDKLEERVNERTRRLAEVNHRLELEVEVRRAAERELLEKQRRLRVLASELALTEERERRELATDLHDSVGQLLAVAEMKAKTLRETADRPNLDAPLAEITGLIDQALQRSRSLTFDLSPPELYRFGLKEAVEYLAAEISREHGLRVAVENNDGACPLSEDMRVILYRATRELLHNVVKHSRADSVTVKLAGDGDNIHVEVRDNGVGIDKSVLETPHMGQKGFGLFSIRERLEYLGGAMEIMRLPEGGTCITLTTPRRIG